MAFGATFVAGLLTLTGCNFDGLYGVTLPGGADLGNHPYTVHAEFADVLDLVPQSSVKVNDVLVGRVESISLNKQNWTADVTMEVNGDVTLPADADADLQQSSLLGEKYIQLVAPPDSQGQANLANDATIPISRTNRNVEVEEVLGALSMVLNGGGIQQIQTISKELNSATTGNEAQIRQLLSNVNVLTDDLNSHVSDITEALDAVNRLSATLSSQKTQIANVISNIGPGLQVLNSQRDQLVSLLQAFSSLSGVAVDTVNKSQADLIGDLKALTPTLQQLAASGASLPNSLQLLLTYPFSDQAAAGIKGDYENLYASIDLNLQDVLVNLGRSRQNPLSSITALQGITGGVTGSPANQPPPLPLPGSNSGSSSGSSGSSGGGFSGGLGGILSTLLGGGS
ncbi:MAG TPA: MCE family protein [Pseudonocardiaceae bacterium]|nr:MCE family protein [Pseudonocardiaceae bacterium]